METQILLNGLIMGSIYILIALGLTLLYGVLHMFNFAHGELYMLGGFSVYYVSEVFGVNYFLGLLAGALVCGFFGFIVERTLLRPLRGDWLSQVIVGLGLSRLIVGVSWQIFGTTEKSAAPVVTGIVHILGSTMSLERIVAGAMGLLAVAALYWFIKTRRSGMAIRAIEQDSEVATLLGVDINRMSSLTVVIGFAVAAISGAIVAPIFMINPGIGESALVKAFTIIIIGGLGSIRGCIVAGLLLGLIDSVGGTMLGSQIANMLSFSFVVVVLLFRPEGIGMHRV